MLAEIICVIPHYNYLGIYYASYPIKRVKILFFYCKLTNYSYIYIFMEYKMVL
jgi:hypothetical protein